MSSVFTGPRRELLLAFDVGTTYSGISYSVLDPGLVPEIKDVTKYPGQGVITAAKIPSIIYYDQSGTPRAFGAECNDPARINDAGDEGWELVEWFKLHLRPLPNGLDHFSGKLEDLPVGKSPIDVLADFYRYLFECARKFIQESESTEFWTNIKDNIRFLLSHPNGWKGPQQMQFRRAAVKAGLITDTPAGQASISFVTEGEATLHFAIRHGLVETAWSPDDGVAIIDAGGGTIDISVYRHKENPLRYAFEEIVAPQCYDQGGVTVTIRARDWLEDFLEEKESPFLDDIDRIVDGFDKATKLRFSKEDDNYFIKFGGARNNDPNVDIRLGQMKVHGTIIAPFFEESISCIVKAVIMLDTMALKKFTHVILAGGFSASEWLKDQVTERLTPLGFKVIRPHHWPDHSVGKAVSDGAVSHYLNHYVEARVPGITYGNKGKIVYNSNDPEHRKRTRKLKLGANGDKELDNFFWTLLPGNRAIPSAHQIRRTYRYDVRAQHEIQDLKCDVLTYDGPDIGDGLFMDNSRNAKKFSKLCTIEARFANLNAYGSAVQSLTGPKGYGDTFYRFTFDLVLEFGGTEVRAYLCWMDNNIEKTSPVQILYDEPIYQTVKVPPPPAEESRGTSSTSLVAKILSPFRR